MSTQKPPTYITLAEAAKLAKLARKYLNVPVYRKKIRGEKINGQWFTTQEWLDQYLQTVRRQVKEEKNRFEEAYIKQSEFIQEQLNKLLAGGIVTAGLGQSQDLPRLLHEQLERLEREKQELAFFFTSQLEDIKVQLLHEQSNRQALIFELQHLREQIDQSVQSRLEELAEQINAKIQERKITEEIENTKTTKLFKEAIPLPSPPVTDISPGVLLPKLSRRHILIGALGLAILLSVGFGLTNADLKHRIKENLALFGTKEIVFSQIGIAAGEKIINSIQQTHNPLLLVNPYLTEDQLTKQILTKLTIYKKEKVAGAFLYPRPNQEEFVQFVKSKIQAFVVELKVKLKS